MGLFSRTLSRLEELKKALTRDPASRQFLALADEYRKQGQTREAISVLERGLAQDPSAVAGHVALGRLLQQGGRLDEALASFSAALKLDPQNLVALRQTADVHLSRGDTVEAIKKLKLFRGLSPGDREVNELIRQLDGELAAAARSAAPAAAGEGGPPSPAPEFRTGGIPVQRASGGSPSALRRDRAGLGPARGSAPCPRCSKRRTWSPRRPRNSLTGSRRRLSDPAPSERSRPSLRAGRPRTGSGSEGTAGGALSSLLGGVR